MASQLLCSLLTFLPFLISKLAIATPPPPPPPPIAKPGCESRCGNVNIPYPFGIGANHCYLDEWFKIDCKRTENSSTVKAFMSKINMEVLNIYYQNNHTAIRVNSPIISSNCSDRKTGKPVDLTGSPFTFSNTVNSFIVLGCTSRVLLTSNSKTTNSSMHNKNLNKQNPPCQNTIPRRHQVFNVSFQEEDEEGDDRCKLAFIVESEWLFAKVEDPNVKVRDRDYVPVILDWSISHTKLPLFRMDDKTTPRHIIYDGDDEKEKGNATWFHLVCNDGYNGNPYLPGGCKDIDECQDPRVNHCRGSICKNTDGSFKCQHVHKSLIIILGSSVGFGVVLLLIGTWRLHKCMKRRKKMKLKEKIFKRNGGLLLKQELCSTQGNVEKTKIFSSKELEKATDIFNVNRILGQGGQGTVYKGMLVDGRIVAVKKSNIIDEAQLKEFINEVCILSQINHRNVIKLFGCCLETEVPLLVYEFVPNGTLYHYLHDPNEEFQLSWRMRLRIAIEVSGALSYLHSAASIPIYHRDIKSTNILLDEKYRAKVSDFGNSRPIPNDQTHLTTNIHGTFGYLDPEYFQLNQFTEKSDVYSFGVVLVELLTGQKPIVFGKSHEDIGLAAHFILSMEKGKLFEILDPRLILEHCVIEEVIVVANLAKRCLNLNGKKRPTMKEVRWELEGIRSSQGDLNVQQNSEEIGSILEDVASISKRSSSSSGEDFSIDVESLVSKTW